MDCKSFTVGKSGKHYIRDFSEELRKNVFKLSETPDFRKWNNLNKVIFKNLKRDLKECKPLVVWPEYHWNLFQYANSYPWLTPGNSSFNPRKWPKIIKNRPFGLGLVEGNGKNRVYGFSRHPGCRTHFEHAIHIDFSVLLGSNGSPPPKKHDSFDTNVSETVVLFLFL